MIATEAVELVAIFSGRWSNTDITYNIQNETPDLASGVQRADMVRGMQVWADVTPLTFTSRQGDLEADFQIFFEPGEHGDGNAFDGPSGVLAHAYFPPSAAFFHPLNGDAHFDEDEFWTSESANGWI